MIKFVVRRRKVVEWCILTIEKRKRAMSKCGRTCEVYSRVTGYMRPVKQWNLGKQEEYGERKPYNLAKSSVEKRRRVA